MNKGTIIFGKITTSLKGNTGNAVKLELTAFNVHNICLKLIINRYNIAIVIMINRCFS